MTGFAEEPEQEWKEEQAKDEFPYVEKPRAYPTTSNGECDGCREEGERPIGMRWQFNAKDFCADCAKSIWDTLGRALKAKGILP